jgi:hypothetical protein
MDDEEAGWVDAADADAAAEEAADAAAAADDQDDLFILDARTHEM